MERVVKSDNYDIKGVMRFKTAILYCYKGYITKDQAMSISREYQRRYDKYGFWDKIWYKTALDKARIRNEKKNG